MTRLKTVTLIVDEVNRPPAGRVKDASKAPRPLPVGVRKGKPSLK